MERGASFSWKSWWWVALFSIGAAVFYLHSLQGKQRSLQELIAKKEALKGELEKLLAFREDLIERIESQNDPAWVEMVLMRDLGVVPEGWLKVHFK